MLNKKGDVPLPDKKPHSPVKTINKKLWIIIGS